MGKKRIFYLAVASIIVVAIVFIVVLVVRATQDTWRTESPDDELIGISYGEDYFNDPTAAKDRAQAAIMDRINKIHQKIYEENKRVADSADRYVKVALLMPLTVSAGRASAIPLDQIEHALQGTYTALKRANRDHTFGDPSRSAIQLILVNQGSRQDASDRLIDKLRGESEEEHPVVAVVGLGSSLPSIEQVVNKLGAEGPEEERIPMVSAITSADTLTGRANFWSVSPSNRQYAAAIRNYLAARTDRPVALMLRDQNNDPYTDSLAEAFSTELKEWMAYPPLIYNGGLLVQPATPNDFTTATTNICTAANDRAKPLNTILYAGRLADFESFVRALATSRSCTPRLTVIAAATGFASAQRWQEIVHEAKIDLLFASPADPAAWLSPNGETGAPVPEGFQDFLESYTAEGYRSEDLVDGMAIAHHDALATAALAIRTGQGDVIPRPIDVAQRLSQLVIAFRVKGASGTLSFPENAGGRATTRHIHIVQLAGEPARDKLSQDFQPYYVE